MPHPGFLIIEAQRKYSISLSLMINVLNRHLLLQQNTCQIRKLVCNTRRKHNFIRVLVPEELENLKTTWVCGSPTKRFVVISEYPAVTQHKHKRKGKVVPVLFVKAYRGNRGVHPLIFKPLNMTFSQSH
jgi:hypothetical protein